MPNDFDSKIDALDAKSSTKADDFDSKIDALGTAAPESSLKGVLSGVGKSLAAAGSNIPVGLASIPEQLINANQMISRNTPQWLAPLIGPTPGSADASDVIANLNQSMGQPATPYLRATDALKQAPLYGGSSANQLSQGHPIASGIGQFAGQLPYWLTGVGEAGALSQGLPLSAKVAAGVASGAGISGAAGGLEEATEEAKENDQVDPDKLMAAIAQNASIGGILGSLTPLASPLIRRLFPRSDVPEPRPMRALPAPKKQLPAVISPQAPLITEPLPTMGPKRLDYHGRVPQTIPKALPYKSPILMGQHPPDWMAPKYEDMRRPPVTQTATKEVQGQILPKEPVPGTPPKTQKTASAPKQAKVKIDIKKPEIKVTDAAVNQRIHELAFVDPEESWRDWWNNNVKPATAQQLPLLRRLARLKIKRDAVGAKLRGALKQIYEELDVTPPLHRIQLNPKDQELLAKAAKDLGGEPDKNVAYTASALAPGDNFPEAHTFKKDGLKAHLEELRDLDADFKEVDGDYRRFKDNRDEELGELLPINESFQVGIHSDEYGNRAVNIRRVWRPTKYKFPNKKAGATYRATREALEAQADPYPELTTPAFKRVVSAVLDEGKNLRIEGLADQGAFDWFNSLGKNEQTKIVLAIGATASLYAGSQQQAEAAPPSNLIAKVVKRLYSGGFKEWMGSGPVTFITKLEMTTDMVSKGFDAESKRYFTLRSDYMQQLERANHGSRHMTDAERDAIRGLDPWQIRRTNKLPNWTQMEKNKAGDIAALNKTMKEITKDEVERLENLSVNPNSLGQAQRYARGVHMDAHDFGVDLGYNPLGPGSEALNALTGEVMKAQALANYGWVVDHAFEAVLATASKYPGKFAIAVKELPTNKLYQEFAAANSPAGFFEQILMDSKGLKIGPYDRAKIDKWVNEKIDNAAKKYLGEAGYSLVAGQLPERAKLGLNSLVITMEEAKDYPDGADQYMRDWIANAKNRTPIPSARELEFNKIAVKIQIEKNIATGFVPHGPIHERTVFQRTGAFSLGISYTRGKIQQSRFVASLMDDALRQLSQGDMMGVAKSIRALVYAHLFLFGAAGSAFVPSYIWFALEQTDRAAYGTTKDVEEIKVELDRLQKNIGPGYQKRELGPAGTVLTGAPSGAVMGLYNSLIRDLHPKTKMDFIKLLADATVVTLLSRIGPFGILNLRYMLTYMIKGFQGHERYVTSEKGIISQGAATTAGKTQILTQRNIKMTPVEGAVKAITRATTPEEVKELQRAEAKSAKRLPKLIKETGKSLQRALKH